MADILSQDEIEALLSADPFKVLLKNEGLSGKQIVELDEQIRKLVARKPSADELDARLAELLEKAFPGKELSAENLKKLQKEVKRLRGGNKKVQEQQRIITSYDFKHPARVNKDQLRTLENLHDNFARLLSSTFSGAMHAVVDVDTAFVDQTTYAEFIMSLSNPSCSYQFTLGPTCGQAILDIAMPVTFAAVDRVFGGKGSSKGVQARQLTPIEIGEINRIVKQMIENLEATWEPILQVNIHDIELETNPEFMQITAASEIVILIAFEVNTTNASGLVSLCYPFFTLESILPLLGQQSYVRANRRMADDLIAQNHQRVQQTQIPMMAELARTQITLGEARSLQVGDVIVTDTHQDEPAVFFMNDEPKLLARSFTGEGGKRMLKVAAEIPPEQEELYKNRCRPVHD